MFKGIRVLLGVLLLVVPGGFFLLLTYLLGRVVWLAARGTLCYSVTHLIELIALNPRESALSLARSLEQRASGAVEGAVPVRQNRRTPLIEKALAPLRGKIAPAQYKKLCAALALVIGPESMVVFRDVLRLDDATARTMRRWTIRAMVEGAMKRPGK